MTNSKINTAENIEKNIQEYCDSIAKKQFELLTLMETNFDYYSKLMQENNKNKDALKNHRDKRLKLIRRLSLLGNALAAANDFYTAINKARCN